MHLRTRLLTQSVTLFILLATVIQVCWGNANATAEIRELEQRIEEAVVKVDLEFLESVYASDFRFTHGDGQVQNRVEWLELVATGDCRSRRISTLDVEIHGNVAITAGRLDVVWRGEREDDKYALRYVRVYERRNGRWVMLSHRTVEMLNA